MSQKRSSQKNSQNRGTVKRSPHFNPEKDAKSLHQSLKTSPEFVIDITASRTNAQRQAIKQLYATLYEKNLEDDLKKNLSGEMQSAVISLYRSSTEFDVHCLHKTWSGIGTDEKVAIEILLTRSNEDKEKIKELYASKHGKTLEKEITSHTHGELRHFLLLLNKACRETTVAECEPSQEKITEWDWNSHGKKKSANEEKKVECLCTKSFEQLKHMFEEYEKETGNDILKMIHKEYSDGMREALSAVVEYSRDPPNYFAERLRAMKKSDHTTLGRIIISRSEIDLSEIKEKLLSIHEKNLEKHVETHTSGNLRKLLLKIINE